MRRSRSAGLAVLAAVVVLGVPAVAGAVPPARWRAIPLAPVSGDTFEVSFEAVTVTPGGVFAAGWARHTVAGTFEIRNVVEQWNGLQWQRMSTPDHEGAPASNLLLGLAGNSANDLWAVGTDFGNTGPSTAYALHHDNADWSMIPLPSPLAGHRSGANDVAVVSRTETWAVGSADIFPTQAALWHRVGSTWTTAVLPRIKGCGVDGVTELTDVTVTPAGAVYAVGTCPAAGGDTSFVLRVRSLTSWDVVKVLRAPSAIVDVDAASDGTVYGVGRLGPESEPTPLLVAISGDVVTSLPRPPGLAGGDLSAIAATASGVTVVGAGPFTDRGQDAYVATWDGATWTRQPVVDGLGVALTAVDGAACCAAAWAVGRGRDLRGSAARPIRR